MSLQNRIRTYLKSPKGQQLVDRGQRELSKPENQAKIRRLLGKRGR